MGSQTYFVNADGVGDFYECVSAASPGQSPATHPAKWVKIEIPAFLREAVVEIAAGQLLQVDGQSDKRAAAKREGQDALYQIWIRHRPRGDYRPLPVHLARA
jgi:hypothetical protein